MEYVELVCVSTGALFPMGQHAQAFTQEPETKSRLIMPGGNIRYLSPGLGKGGKHHLVPAKRKKKKDSEKILQGGKRRTACARGSGGVLTVRVCAHSAYSGRARTRALMNN